MSHVSLESEYRSRHFLFSGRRRCTTMFRLASAILDVYPHCRHRYLSGMAGTWTSRTQPSFRLSRLWEYRSRHFLFLHGWGEWPYLFWPFSSWLCSHNAGICSPVNWRRHSVPGPLAYMTRQRPFRCHFNMTHTYVSCESVKKGYQVLT